jgi:hypothetical protein
VVWIGIYFRFLRRAYQFQSPQRTDWLIRFLWAALFRGIKKAASIWSSRPGGK